MAVAATHRVGDDGLTLADYIDSWCGHVERFHRELRLDWQDRELNAWGVDDLVAAYRLRAIIERTIVSSALERPHALVVADRFLCTFTASHSTHWARLAGQAPGAEWWWHRLPISGPVVDELESFGLSEGNS